VSPRPQLAIGTYGNINTTKQADGSWVALARFRDDDGETRRVKATGRSKSGAEAALKEKFKTRTNTTGDMNGESTVRELAERYYAGKEGEDLAANTYYNLRRSLDNHIIKRLGGLKLREVTPPRVEAVVASITKENGPGTALMVRSVMSGMFADATRWGAVVTNPVTYTPRPRLEQKRIRALTVDEVVRLRALVASRLRPFTYEERIERAEKLIKAEVKAGKLAAPVDPRTRMGGKNRSQTLLDIMDYLLATGCRASEPPGLAWVDVHLDDPVPWVFIHQQVQRSPGKGLFVTRTKEHDERYLRLPGFAVEMLRRRRETVRGPMVFPSERGTLLAGRQVGTAWGNAVRGSEFEWVTLKTLRKTVATLVAESHGSALAANQLGHSSDKMTRQFYIAQSMAPVESSALDLFQPKALETSEDVA